ncbi:hypothetical protein B0H13DRAFT_2649129 [Mycena leptocephala]|nr:hypothetical protein B0H13DRAFT_2649129 [Mycena leptocephala]
MAISPELDALVALVKQEFANSFIGFSVATAFYGITVLQVYLYYRNYAADRVTLKCVVALLFLLDTLATVFVAHSLYTFFVLNFGKPPVEDLATPWSYFTEKLIVTLITFVAQWRYGKVNGFSLHKGSQSTNSDSVTVNKAITFSIVNFSGRGLPRSEAGNKDYQSDISKTFLSALGIVTTIDLFTIKNVIGTVRFSIISGFVQGLAALNDLLITAAMCYYLNDNRSGLLSTNQFVDTVILYTVSRGILTATLQILFLITVRVASTSNTYILNWDNFRMSRSPETRTSSRSTWQSAKVRPTIFSAVSSTLKPSVYVNAVLSTSVLTLLLSDTSSFNNISRIHTGRLNVRRTFQPKSEVQYDTGPGFNFFHNDGTGQSRPEPLVRCHLRLLTQNPYLSLRSTHTQHTSNDLNSITDNAETPDREQKPCESGDLKV